MKTVQPFTLYSFKISFNAILHRTTLSSDSLSGCPGLKSWPEDRLSWLRFLGFFLSTSRRLPGQYLKLGHNRFFPHPLKFIIIALIMEAVALLKRRYSSTRLLGDISQKATRRLRFSDLTYVHFLYSRPFEGSAQCFGGKARRKETTWKTKAKMRIESEWSLGRLAGECRVDPVGSAYGPVTGCCKYDDEPSDSSATELVRPFDTVCNL
jgi:hypothetical protein